VYLSPRGRAAYRRIAVRLAEVQQSLLDGVPQSTDLMAALDQLAD